jgi:ASC-1-like (ASCH) protein
MATEPIKINTGKYNKQGKVDVDGKIWTVKLPGAGTEMRLSQAQRRLTMLDQKVENKTATEEDLDKYDSYELVVYETFKSMFKDNTKNNSEVSKWVEETPLAIMVQVFEDLKEQANGRKDSPTTT